MFSSKTMLVKGRMRWLSDLNKTDSHSRFAFSYKIERLHRTLSKKIFHKDPLWFITGDGSASLHPSKSPPPPKAMLEEKNGNH